MMDVMVLMNFGGQEHKREPAPMDLPGMENNNHICLTWKELQNIHFTWHQTGVAMKHDWISYNKFKPAIKDQSPKYHRKTEEMTVIIYFLNPKNGEEFANISCRLTEEVDCALHSDLYHLLIFLDCHINVPYCKANPLT